MRNFVLHEKQLKLGTENHQSYYFLTLIPLPDHLPVGYTASDARHIYRSHLVVWPWYTSADKQGFASPDYLPSMFTNLRPYIASVAMPPYPTRTKTWWKFSLMNQF